MTAAGRCVYCHAEINPKRDYRKVSGWARSRGATGGTNALREKVEQDEWACMFCIERPRNIAPLQGQMTIGDMGVK